MVQEFIEGDANVLYSFAGYAIGGKVQDGLTAHRKRQHPMRFGSASTYVKVKKIPKLEKIGNQILKESNYSGPFEIEFMYDKKVKEFKLLEVNARFWGWHTILPASGHNIIGNMIEKYLGEIDYKNNNTIKDYKKCWTHLLTDLFVIFQEGLKGNLNVYKNIKTINNCEFGIYNKDDLFPFFWEIISSPLNMLKRRK
jgi:predicted ATP-grasp superfamily ATP-dependent carboligase